MADKVYSKREYLSNYEFEVQLGTSIRVAFSKITNLSCRRDFEVIPDGGNNTRVCFAEKAKRQPDTVSFQKGILPGGDSDVLEWLTAGLKIHEIMILVRQKRELKKIFFIEQGVITNIAFSDLNALNAEIMIKTMELQHSGIEEVPV